MTEAEVDRIVEATPLSERGHFVDGYLAFDPATSIARVTITGLRRPFEEHVNLSDALRE